MLDVSLSGRHWREDKVGLAMTMHSVVSENDPCPEIPKTFLDPKRVGKIVRGLKKSSAPRAEEEAAAKSPTEADAKETEEAEKALKETLEDLTVKYEGPKLEERRVVAKALRYLQNNRDKMKYAEYRKQGLPVVSSLVESMVKQISRRVKGTEKFWSEEGASVKTKL